MKLLLRGAGIAAVLLVFATAASAQATRTWVSGVGDDVNPCSRTAPCKTWAGAISKTAAGGEIDALDDGGFGTLTITKSITIDGGGHMASTLASGTTGFIVNAGSTDVVTLRRISINGAGVTPGLYGIRILAAKHVNIENSEIFGFRTAPGYGVIVDAAASVGVQIINSRMENNNVGVGISDFGTVTIVSCSIVGNVTAGIDASGTGAPPLVLVSNSNISLNAIGIQVGATAIVRITHNDIVAAFPALTWNIAGGTIQTYRDNRVIGSGTGSLTDVP
jgi:hypothetical protein